MTCTPHPAIETRAHVLRYLARKFPSRSLDDREDAAHEAVCTVIRLGRPDGKREATNRAARALIGRRVQKGKSYSSRTPATSIAGSSLRGLDGEPVPPDEWLDSSYAVATQPDPVAAIDIVARKAHQESIPEAMALLESYGLSRREIAEETGYSKRGLQEWASGNLPNEYDSRGECAAAALRVLLARIRKVATKPAQIDPVVAERWNRAEQIARERAERKAALARRPDETEAQWMIRLLLAERTLISIGREVGVTIATASRWKYGHATPAPERLDALRAIFACRKLPGRSTP